MKIAVVFFTTIVIAGCNSQPTFDLPTSGLDLVEIVKWKNELYFSEGVAGFYKLKGDSLIEYSEDSIVDIKQCSEQTYILKAPNDSTFIIVYPDNTENIITNKTDLKSEYFKLHLNEKCQILLEYGTAFFKVQEDNSIDYEMAYGFNENISPNGSDQVGYFDNFVFLIKYPERFSGGLLTVYLDSSSIHSLPKTTKVRDFTIHNNRLLLAEGYHEILGDKELMESGLKSIGDGEVKEMNNEVSGKYDISRIFSDGSNIYFLSEKFGFYKLINGKPELLISISLHDSNIGPKKFMVDNGKIYLTTWKHGLLIFEGQKEAYDLKQIK